MPTESRSWWHNAKNISIVTAFAKACLCCQALRDIDISGASELYILVRSRHFLPT